MLALVGGMSWLGLIILCIVIAGAVAILLVALPAIGITLPEWFKRIVIIVAVCVVAIIAIIILASFITSI